MIVAEVVDVVVAVEVAVEIVSINLDAQSEFSGFAWVCY